jgi:hypothetical protein
MCPRSIAQRRLGIMATTAVTNAAIAVGGVSEVIVAAMVGMKIGVVDAPEGGCRCLHPVHHDGFKKATDRSTGQLQRTRTEKTSKTPAAIIHFNFQEWMWI